MSLQYVNNLSAQKFMSACVISSENILFCSLVSANYEGELALNYEV